MPTWFLLFLATSWPAYADEAAVRAWLTPEDPAAWDEVAVRMFLGEAGCLEGVTWVFGRDGALAISTCTDGKLVPRTSTWSWVRTDDGVDVISADGEELAVHPRTAPDPRGGSHPPKKVTVLRGLRTSQDEPVIERVLTFRGAP